MDKTNEKQGISPAQIEAWKQQYGPDAVYEYATSDGLKGYFRRPDRRVISLAVSSGQTDPMRVNEVLATNCWLGGDEAIRTEDRYFLGLVDVLGGLIDKVAGELKKV